MMNFADIKVSPKIPTGIDGFEHVSMGGLPQGRTTLVAGSSGSGKTIFGSELVYRSVTEFGRKAVYVTLEESCEDIVRNVLRLGWNLGELASQGKIEFIDGSRDPDIVEEVGEFNLEGLMTQIAHAVKSIGAEIVVLDSIGALFHQYANTSIIRREIFRITSALKDLGVTSIMTAERLAEYGAISRHGVEEFASDNVLILRNVLEDEKCRRTIQVLKMRGDMHHKGEYPFTISETGVNIIPLSAVELKQASSLARVSSGNPVLDQMTNGGFFRDSLLLVSGPTGGGKTLMSTTFTSDACNNGEKVLLLAYEESHQQLLRNAQSWGVNFQQWEEEGLLRIVCQYPEAMGVEDHLLAIRREIEDFHPQRLVVDSISAMERVASLRTFREFIIGLTSYAKQEEICSMCTSTTPRLSGGDSITEAHISTITDAIILLRYVEIGGVMRRGLSVIKMRGSQHDKQIREFTIDGEGMHIGEPFKNVHNIILGVPYSSGPSESDRLRDMFPQ